MIATLFLFGTLWFWVLSFVFIGFIVYTLEDEDPSAWPYILTVGFICLTYWMGNRDAYKEIFSYLINNPSVLVLCFAGYLISGAVWSLVRWFLYLKGLSLDTYESGKVKHSKDKFEVSTNKGRITNWMIYWPFSLVWTFIDEPIKKSFKWIYSKLEGKYRKISENITKDLKF